MKKFLVLVGISVLLFFSCSLSVGTVFDDSVPVEQSAEIYTFLGTVTGYNGIAVDWKQYKLVRIPAGDTLLDVDLWMAKGMSFRYNFQPQKKYYLSLDRKGGLYGVSVYTFEIGEKLPKEDDDKVLASHLTAFVPFLNAGINRKTVLE